VAAVQPADNRTITSAATHFPTFTLRPFSVRSFFQLLNDSYVVKLIYGRILCGQQHRTAQEFENLLETAISKRQILIEAGRPAW
jgi:hypothetical protein